MITLDLNKRGRLDPLKFEKWEIRYIEKHTFEEMWEDAVNTLLPGCKYNRIGNLWLEKQGVKYPSGSCSYPERTLVEGEPKFK